MTSGLKCSSSPVSPPVRPPWHILPILDSDSFFNLVVTTISELTDHNLGINNQMITVLGLVLGLVVSFRTSSAYERYSEGRKLWSALTLASRNLAMGVSPPFSQSTPVLQILRYGSTYQTTAQTGPQIPKFHTLKSSSKKNP